MKFQNKFTVKVIDRTGGLKDSFSFSNLVTQAGKVAVLNNNFFASVPLVVQYIGAILSEETTDITAQDTLANKSWTEATQYAARPVWTPTAAEAVTETDAASIKGSVSILATGNESWAGFFVAADATVGETVSDLFAAALFPQGLLNLKSGDTVNVTYEITID